MMDGRTHTIRQLQRQLHSLARAQRPADRREACRTGIPALDALLPEGGLVPGTLAEWMAGDVASGMGTLVFRITAQLLRAGDACVLIDGGGLMYPPAISRLGIPLDTIIVVRPERAQQALWAWEQSLRCPGVAVVIGRLNRLQTSEFRRLQLAAETGGAIGMLLCSARDRRQQSWADLRLYVEPLPSVPTAARSGRERAPPRSRLLHVELAHSRGHFRTGTLLLDIDDETGAVHHIPRVAAAATARRSAGA
jgi:protein ImuA